MNCIGVNREPPVAAEGFANISKFASKMLERYGFQEGQGLGKNNQGIPGALRVEKLTDKGGVIVAGDEEVKLEEFTLVPGTAGSKNKANKGFINFIPAPENKDLKPLQVENNFSEAIVKKHFWPARKKKTAVPQNPYFNEKIRRRQVETGHLNGSADDPPPNPYFVRTRAKANSYKQYFIKIFPYNVCDGSPAPAARPARRAAPSGKTKNNCNNRNNQVSCTVLNCCWAGGGNLTLLRGLGRVPAWRGGLRPPRLYTPPPAKAGHSRSCPRQETPPLSPGSDKPGCSPGYKEQGMSMEVDQYCKPCRTKPSAVSITCGNWKAVDICKIWVEEKRNSGNPPLPHREAIATADVFFGGRMCEACEFYGNKKVHSGEESLACPNIKFMLITYNQLGQAEFCKLYKELSSWYNMTLISQRNELNNKISERMWTAVSGVWWYSRQLGEITWCASCATRAGLTVTHCTEEEARQCKYLTELTDIFLQSDPKISGGESLAMTKFCKLVKRNLMPFVMVQIAELIAWLTHATFIKICKDKVDFDLRECETCHKFHPMADILKPDGYCNTGLGCQDAARFWTRQRYLASNQSKEVLRESEREFLLPHQLQLDHQDKKKEGCMVMIQPSTTTIINESSEISDSETDEVCLNEENYKVPSKASSVTSIRKRKDSEDLECGACEYSDSEDEETKFYSPDCKGKSRYWARRARRSCLGQLLIALGQLGIGLFVMMMILNVSRAEQNLGQETAMQMEMLEWEFPGPGLPGQDRMQEQGLLALKLQQMEIWGPNRQEEKQERMDELDEIVQHEMDVPDAARVDELDESVQHEVDGPSAARLDELDEGLQREMDESKKDQVDELNAMFQEIKQAEHEQDSVVESCRIGVDDNKDDLERELQRMRNKPWRMMVPSESGSYTDGVFIFIGQEYDRNTLYRSLASDQKVDEENVWNIMDYFYYSNQLVWPNPVLDNKHLVLGAGQEAIMLLITLLCSGVRAAGPQMAIIVSLVIGPWAEAARVERATQSPDKMPLWIGEEHALQDPTTGEKALQSWRYVAGFDTTGYYSGKAPSVHLLSLVEYGQCEEPERVFMDPMPIEIQANHVLEHEEVLVAVCSVHIEYSQLWCTTDIYSHREAEIVICPKRRLVIPAEQCKRMYNEGSATLNVYERTKNFGNELDTVLFLTNLNNGTVNTVDLIAGREHEDNACSGAEFAFMGQRYEKNLLYRHMTITIEKYTGEYYDIYDKVVIRNLVDIPSGQDSVEDDKFGTLVVVDRLDRKKEKCQRATELFTGRATVHPRVDDENKGIAFVQKDGQDTAFVITGRSEGCGRIFWETSVRSVLLLPIAEDNPKLEIKLQDRPDLVSEVKHQLAATAASTVFQLQQNFAGIASNECKLKQNAEANFKKTLMVANQEQLGDILLGATISNGGSALNIIQGVPLKMKFRNYKPSATSDGLCCRQLPVTFKNHNNEQVFAFLEPISRMIVQRCTPVPCSRNHPIVLAIPSAQEVDWVIENPDMWTWQRLVEEGYDGRKEDNMFYVCDYGDGRGLIHCEMPTVPKLFNNEMRIPIGWANIIQNLKSTMWNGETEQAEFEIQRDQANHAVLHRELVAMAGGHVITGGVAGQLIQNAPPEVKASLWDSIFAFNAITEPGTTANNLLITVTVVIGVIIVLIGAVICCNIWTTVQVLWMSLVKSIRNCCRTGGLLRNADDNMPMIRRQREICTELDNHLLLIGNLEQRDLANRSRIEILERGLEQAHEAVRRSAALLAAKAENGAGSAGQDPTDQPGAVPARDQEEGKAKPTVTLEEKEN